MPRKYLEAEIKMHPVIDQYRKWRIAENSINTEFEDYNPAEKYQQDVSYESSEDEYGHEHEDPDEKENENKYGHDYAHEEEGEGEEEGEDEDEDEDLSFYEY